MPPLNLDTSLLGAKVIDDGARFGLWAPRAEKVVLCLVDKAGVVSEVSLSARGDGVWAGFVAGVVAGQRYGYRVHGPWDPASGARFNPARLLCDPYARAVCGEIDYSSPFQDYLQADPSQPNPADSLGSVPLSVVVADSAPPAPVRRRRSLIDSVIYELHVKGFTQLHPEVPEHLRGTYAGLGTPAVVDYLKELGVTAVELLPVQHFVAEPFVAKRGLDNYWGYNPIGFFAPHASYAAAGDAGGQVAEFKKLVSTLHEAGIEVILDVVYNHTGEGGLEGPTLNFRGIDQAAYYRLAHDRLDDFDVTGCGNSVDTATPMVAQLVVDSLKYWVSEMGVDGFRFDLATTLFRDSQHHVDFQHPLKLALDRDPFFADIKLIAEPWDIGPYGYQVGAFGQGWSEWNDCFRNYVRDYWRGASTGVQELATRLAGSPDLYDKAGRSPAASINFVTAHDGFTMRDLVSYDVKHNSRNGESNRDGTDDNRSWNHGCEGLSDDPEVEELRARQVLNLMATQLLAAGVPMLLAGDEIGRTQHGNNNAYCQDNEISWVDWDSAPRWQKVRSRVEELLRLRAQFSPLRPESFRHGMEVVNEHGENLQRLDLMWLAGQHGQFSEDDWHDPQRRLLGMYVSDVTSAVVAWFNSAPKEAQVFLPGLPWASSYSVIWHSGDLAEVPSGQLPADASFTVPGRSVVLLSAEVPQTHSALVGLRADSNRDALGEWA